MNSDAGPRQNSSRLMHGANQAVPVGAPALPVCVEQRVELVHMSRSTSLPHRTVLQARGLLWAADGVANQKIARRCGVDSDTVRRWRTRFAEKGVGEVGVIAAALVVGKALQQLGEIAVRPQRDEVQAVPVEVVVPSPGPRSPTCEALCFDTSGTTLALPWSVEEAHGRGAVRVVGRSTRLLREVGLARGERSAPKALARAAGHDQTCLCDEAAQRSPPGINRR